MNGKRRGLALLLAVGLCMGMMAAGAEEHVFDVHPDYAPMFGASQALKDAAGAEGGHQGGGFAAAVQESGRAMEDVPEHFTRQAYSVEVVTESSGGGWLRRRF